MDIPPEKMAAYKRTARLRQAQREQEMAERRQRAWQVARQAARMLKEEYGATQVFVFGSLAHGAWFHARLVDSLPQVWQQVGQELAAFNTFLSDLSRADEE